jgi:hypothetical protein
MLLIRFDMLSEKLYSNILLCLPIYLLKRDGDVGDIILVYRGISGVLTQNGRFQESIAWCLASSIWALI